MNRPDYFKPNNSTDDLANVCFQTIPSDLRQIRYLPYTQILIGAFRPTKQPSQLNDVYLKKQNRKGGLDNLKGLLDSKKGSKQHVSYIIRYISMQANQRQ